MKWYLKIPEYFITHHFITEHVMENNNNSVKPAHFDADLWNPDLAPTTEATRTWNWLHFASLWVAMVVCVPTYMLAAGLVSEGMTWYQAIITVLLGNAIVL
ncbi:MAG: NCS1 family nucleobase:cation symporter-1, partial [Paraglaciecola sp.]